MVYQQKGPLSAIFFTELTITYDLYNQQVYRLEMIFRKRNNFHGQNAIKCRGTGIRGLMRGMATLPKVTRSY